jgi:hypothetical protein
MPKLDFQTIRMHVHGARWLLPRAGYVVYGLLGFGQLMINTGPNADLTSCHAHNHALNHGFKDRICQTIKSGAIARQK